MFADYELQAHRLVEQGQPVTADVLSNIYRDLVEAYYGDSLDEEPLSYLAWTRIPHFFSAPYYVYQYATCFASAAKLAAEITSGPADARAHARKRFLALLRAGGSDHPMELLRRAGIDLGEPSTVRAVIDQLDRLVAKLEAEIEKL
jgi:oligoendopeptidase F